MKIKPFLLTLKERVSFSRKINFKTGN